MSESQITPPAMRTLRMTLAYDGTNYCGWQVQPNGLALQAVVEQALAEFTGEALRVVASGRTDAGVHAVGQVISFETRSTAPCRGFLQGLPVHLPPDVVVRDVVEALPGFNARFDARRKWYRYVIHNSAIRIPFLHRYAFWHRTRLDAAAMNDALQVLAGTHDFRCFETQWPNRSSSVRTIFRARVCRRPGWNVWDAVSQRTSWNVDESAAEPMDDAFVCLDVEADGFLYNMVRAIAGTLIHVGRGRWARSDLERILESGSRVHAGETAPPQGLYLMRVDYDTPTSAATSDEPALSATPNSG